MLGHHQLGGAQQVLGARQSKEIHSYGVVAQQIAYFTRKCTKSPVLQGEDGVHGRHSRP